MDQKLLLRQQMRQDFFTYNRPSSSLSPETTGRAFGMSMRQFGEAVHHRPGPGPIISVKKSRSAAAAARSGGVSVFL